MCVWTRMDYMLKVHYIVGTLVNITKFKHFSSSSYGGLYVHLMRKKVL